MSESKKRIHICKTCGTQFVAYGNRSYCSRACLYKAPNGNKGRHFSFPARKTGETRRCEQCGKEWYRHAKSNQTRFCSADCYFKNRWGDRRITLKCAFCSKDFRRLPGQTTKQKKSVYCSVQCRFKGQQAEGSHFWRGGKTAPYVGTWKEQRAKARERDRYRCVICGSEDRIQVHHIIPYRYSKSHSLDNLKTLCRSCHSKEELKVNALMRKVMADGRALAHS